MKPPLVIRGHLGLGDHLITNAIVRKFSKDHEAVFIPCKAHNFTSARFMWGDLSNVSVVPVEGDVQADEFCWCFKGGVLRIGMFGDGFSFEQWDKCMYEQAWVPFEERWLKWKVIRNPQRELKPPECEFCFVHEDAKRGYAIDRRRLPRLPLVFADPKLTRNIFDWTAHIVNATELHLMESCFGVMADSLPELNARRVAIHAYMRKSIPPAYKRNFEIFK